MPRDRQATEHGRVVLLSQSTRGLGYAGATHMVISSAQGMLAARPNSCVHQGHIVTAYSFRFGSALVFGSPSMKKLTKVSLGAVLMAIPAPMTVMPGFGYFREVVVVVCYKGPLTFVD